jgi:hypothetical protein
MASLKLMMFDWACVSALVNLISFAPVAVEVKSRRSTNAEATLFTTAPKNNTPNC